MQNCLRSKAENFFRFILCHQRAVMAAIRNPHSKHIAVNEVLARPFRADENRGVVPMALPSASMVAAFSLREKGPLHIFFDIDANPDLKSSQGANAGGHGANRP